MKTKRITISFRDTVLEKLQTIADATGLSDSTGKYYISQVVQRAIADSFEKHTPPAYARTRSVAKTRTTKKQLEETETKEFKDERQAICDILHGETIDDNGKLSCRYQVIDRINPHNIEEYEWTVPFSQLSEATIKNQFRGKWTEEEKQNYHDK